MWSKRQTPCHAVISNNGTCTVYTITIPEVLTSFQRGSAVGRSLRIISLSLIVDRSQGVSIPPENETTGNISRHIAWDSLWKKYQTFSHSTNQIVINVQ